ncbi:MAG: OmpH family outer membrane protein [Bacteroidales bacterium]|nr:OmpH family outer membrane protein [Bacteroidales bacterium]
MKRFVLSAVLFFACLLAAQAQRFALVDMEYIFQQLPDYAQANQQLESLTQQWQREVEAKANEAKALYEAYQQSAASLTAAQRTAKEDAIVAKEREAAELRKKYFGPEGEAVKKRESLMAPIQDAVYKAVKELATRHGYDVVIDRASAQSMIFASPKIDISNEVLSKLGYSN